MSLVIKILYFNVLYKAYYYRLFIFYLTTLESNKPKNRRFPVFALSEGKCSHYIINRVISLVIDFNRFLMINIMNLINISLRIKIILDLWFLSLHVFI